MSLKLRKCLAILLAIAFTSLAVPAQCFFADDHAVSAADLHQVLVDSAKTRQTNVETVQKFFSSKIVKNALSKQVVTASKVEKAIPLLNDEELIRLASQCRQVENDISAGSLSNQEITYILIALATAVIILVIVVA